MSGITAASDVVRGLPLHLCTLGTWPAAGKAHRKDVREASRRLVGKMLHRPACNRARRRIVSYRELLLVFLASDTYPESGSSRTGLRRDCHGTACGEVEVGARTSRRACTLRGYSYKLRTAIDTKQIRGIEIDRERGQGNREWWRKGS